MKRGPEAGGETQTGLKNWSILAGEFMPDENFPSLDKINQARSIRETYEDEEIREPLFFSNLILDALEATQPGLFEERTSRVSIATEIREAAIYYLNQFQLENREDEMKKMAFKSVEPRDVPIMQAIDAMAEHGLVNQEDDILKGIVRLIWARQSGAAGE
jgi:hypothetical protein